MGLSCRLPPSSPRFAGGRRRRSAPPTGFTLVEMVLAGALMAVALGGAAATLLVANRSSGRQGALSQLEALIDQDLAAIQRLDRSFSCCTGTCTNNAATIAAANATTCRSIPGTSPPPPGNENYYSPRQSATPTAAEATAMTAFTNACTGGTIAATFAGLLPTLPTAQAPASLSRSLNDNNSTTPVDPAAHRMRITYTGTYEGSVITTRVVNIIPTAAAWCP